MAKTAHVETCDCPSEHYRSVSGRCINASLRSEEPELADESRCGCCLADCPDVHAQAGAEFFVTFEALFVAAEYVATLHPDRQRDLASQETRGELRIVPRAEMPTTR